MGCDIHAVVQVRKEGKWETIDDRGPEGVTGGYRWRVLSNRNYAVFSILANVRNFSTAVPWPSIANPRGLPDEFGMEDECHTDAMDDDLDGEKMWMGDHSHSWVTLQELDEYDWSHVRHYESGPPYSAEDACGDFYLRVIPWLRSLGNPEDVRLVFGFDS